MQRGAQPVPWMQGAGLRPHAGPASAQVWPRVSARKAAEEAGAEAEGPWGHREDRAARLAWSGLSCLCSRQLLQHMGNTAARSDRCVLHGGEAKATCKAGGLRPLIAPVVMGCAVSACLTGTGTAPHVPGACLGRAAGTSDKHGQLSPSAAPTGRHGLGCPCPGGLAWARAQQPSCSSTKPCSHQRRLLLAARPGSECSAGSAPHGLPRARAHRQVAREPGPCCRHSRLGALLVPEAELGCGPRGSVVVSFGRAASRRASLRFLLGCGPGASRRPCPPGSLLRGPQAGAAPSAQGAWPEPGRLLPGRGQA